MKTKIVPIISIITLIVSFFCACDDTSFKEYMGYSPVYLSYTDLRAAVKTEVNTDLKNPGKIYFKDNFIFIVEELKGIHVYDNSNPSSPVQKAFVNIPGVVDISMSGFYMYADSYIDLVVLNMSDINNITEVGRVKDIFQYTIPAHKTDYPVPNIDKTKGVVIDWELKKIKERIYNNNPVYPVYEGRMMDSNYANISGSASGVGGSGIGIGGSMARFGINGNALYILAQNNLKILNISDKINPTEAGSLYVSWNVETMFLNQKYMFLGTTTGMVIYDISDPLNPNYKSFFIHARSCDPVIVDGNNAYVTLRSGTTCGSSNNSLNIVNIEDITLPKLVKSYLMVNPHGLGKDGDLLFICDGDAGLKIYNCSDLLHITDHLVYTYTNINAYDVIPVGNVLVTVGDDGLFQYGYSDIANIRLLSTIPVVVE
jgi:hypothetical protein